MSAIVLLLFNFEPRGQVEIGRKLFDSVPNGLGGARKAAVPQATTPLSCKQLGGCHVVKVGHDDTMRLLMRSLTDCGGEVTGFGEGAPGSGGWWCHFT